MMWMLAGIGPSLPRLADAAPTPGPLAAPARAAGVDNSQVIDVNNIRMFVTNTGSVAYDKTTGSPGLEFPRGTGRTCVFAAGLWLGGKVGGVTRVAISEYSDEFGPGAMVGTAPDDPNRPEYRVYKLWRTYSSAIARNTALADYQAGAVPHGAPPVVVLPDGSLDILGDQMLWAVYNDADPAHHTNRAGSTQPLGVEVRQTTFASNRLGALGNSVFIKYKIINKGGNQLDSMYVSQWSDPDDGYALDDLVGCDPSIGLGFVYNATNSDVIYGSTVPAVGYDFFQGPKVLGVPLSMTSFNKYINGTDPDGPSKTYNFMKGLNSDGTPVINPVTHLATNYQVDGDPVAATGWLDINPADRRLMLSSGPFSMAPGDTQEVVTGIVIGQSIDRLSSVSQMRHYDDLVQAAYDGGNPNVGVPAGAPPASRLALTGARPNPVRSDLALDLVCAHAGAVRVEVFDLGGRRVLDRGLGEFGPGTHSLRLDMRALGAGLYLVRVRQGMESAVVRAVRMR